MPVETEVAEFFFRGFVVESGENEVAWGGGGLVECGGEKEDGEGEDARD